MQLNQTPPAASVFLGWNNAPVANYEQCDSCTGSATRPGPRRLLGPAHGHLGAHLQPLAPRPADLTAEEDVAGTEGGSSGSPVVNASSQVVGQLSGACGTK